MSSRLLILRVLDAPRFLNRTGTDSIFSFRVLFLRERERGENLERIEEALKDQFLLNWAGAPPSMFIYGDSPDRDERAQGSLVIGLASSDAEDKFGLPVGFLTETVETRIRTGARAELRDSALGTLNAAYANRYSNLLLLRGKAFPLDGRAGAGAGEKENSMMKPFVEKKDVVELFEALKNFSSDPRCAEEVDKILLEVSIDGKGEADVVRVPLPRSAAATFASVSAG